MHAEPEELFRSLFSVGDYVIVTVQEGTVSPDFCLHFHRRRMMATVDMHRYEFKYIRSFADLFLLIIDS